MLMVYLLKGQMTPQGPECNIIVCFLCSHTSGNAYHANAYCWIDLKHIEFLIISKIEKEIQINHINTMLTILCYKISWQDAL